MPKALIIPGAMAKAALTRGSRTCSAGVGSTGQVTAEMLWHHAVIAPTPLESEVTIGADLGATDPERGEAALRVAGHADPIGIYQRSPVRIAQQERHRETYFNRPLPPAVRQIAAIPTP